MSMKKHHTLSDDKKHFSSTLGTYCGHHINACAQDMPSAVSHQTAGAVAQLSHLPLSPKGHTHNQPHRSYGVNIK